MTGLEISGAPTRRPHGPSDLKDPARTQALCWLLDELLDAEDDLLELVARPGALVGWRRERLGEFCRRAGEALVAE